LGLFGSLLAAKYGFETVLVPFWGCFGTRRTDVEVESWPSELQ